MTRSDDTMLVKQSSSFSRKHRILSVRICIRQTVWLTAECGAGLARTYQWYTGRFRKVAQKNFLEHFHFG